jgi:integrase
MGGHRDNGPAPDTGEVTPVTPTPNHKGRGTRKPVDLLGHRVPGLYERVTASGRQVFEYRGRLNGQFANRVLKATNKTEAAAEVGRLRATARDDRTITLDRTLTVVRLAERFLAAVDADPRYAPRTRVELRVHVNKHIIPALGRTKVCDLDALSVRRFARELQTKRSATHRNIVSALSSMLAWACAEGFAAENAVRRAKERFPRDMRRTDATRFEPRALTDAELALVLGEVDATYKPVVGFLAETGARLSEALAVRFGDVDLQAGTWTVAGQLADDGTVRAAKTPGSMATVPLSRTAVTIVKERRSELMRRGFGSAAADAFVFVGLDGQPLRRHMPLAAWQRATRAALGVSLRLHDLRTTFASRLAANNVDVATAQALLRHAKPTTTLDVYVRVRGDSAAKLEQMRVALEG